MRKLKKQKKKKSERKEERKNTSEGKREGGGGRLNMVWEEVTTKVAANIINIFEILVFSGGNYHHKQELISFFI